jgi:hypothetical protein
MRLYSRRHASRSNADSVSVKRLAIQVRPPPVALDRDGADIAGASELARAFHVVGLPPPGGGGVVVSNGRAVTPSLANGVWQSLTFSVEL